jgi:phage tail-like protein
MVSTMPTLQLIVQLQGVVVKVVPLNKPVLRIGRGPDSDLMLDHAIISRHHAELRLSPQGLMLTDLGSSNGTYVGEQRLLPNQPQLLREGASFRMGPYLLLVRAAADAEAAGAAGEAPAEASEPGAPAAAERLPLPTVEEQPAAASPLAAGVAHESALPALHAARSRTPVSSPPGASIGGLYIRYLPDIYQENDFLERFLHIFADIWEPLEQRQDHIEMYFDPRTCPQSFLPWLASWLDIPLNPHWSEARKRRLLAQAWELYSWRGTLYGLKRMIEICTGLAPEITENPAEPFVFRVRIRLQPTADGEAVDRAFIEELIQAHKPAHAGYILEVVT